MATSEKSAVSSGIPFMSTFQMAHIAVEVIALGGISFYFNKRISKLEAENEQLVKKMEEMIKNGGGGSGVDPEILESIKGLHGFNATVESHIKKLYGMMNDMRVGRGPQGGTTPHGGPHRQLRPRQPTETLPSISEVCSVDDSSCNSEITPEQMEQDLKDDEPLINSSITALEGVAPKRKLKA